MSMNTWIFTLLLVSFGALAVFGLPLMDHERGCMAEAVQGMPCPQNDPLANVIFHLSAFKAFVGMNALLAAMGVLLSIALVALRSLAHSKESERAKETLAVRYVRGNDERPSRSAQALTAWISFLEHSPSVS